MKLVGFPVSLMGHLIVCGQVLFLLLYISGKNVRLCVFGMLHRCVISGSVLVRNIVRLQCLRGVKYGLGCLPGALPGMQGGMVSRGMGKSPFWFCSAGYRESGLGGADVQ